MGQCGNNRVRSFTGRNDRDSLLRKLLYRPLIGDFKGDAQLVDSQEIGAQKLCHGFACVDIYMIVLDEMIPQRMAVNLQRHQSAENITVADFAEALIDLRFDTCNIRKVIFLIVKENDFFSACAFISAIVSHIWRGRKDFHHGSLLLLIEKIGRYRSVPFFTLVFQIIQMCRKPGIIGMINHRRCPVRSRRQR